MRQSVALRAVAWRAAARPRPRTLGLLLSAGVLLGALTACAPQSQAAEVGAWGDAKGPNLTINSRGELTGNDGCNHLFGTWRASTEGVEFTEVAITEMYCDGVDVWLSALSTAKAESGVLRVFDASGDEIGTLERQPAAQ